MTPVDGGFQLTGRWSFSSGCDHCQWAILGVMLDRGDYWQCAFVIPKDGFDAVKRRGLEAFREELARVAPFMRDRAGVLTPATAMGAALAGRLRSVGHTLATSQVTQ